MDIQAKVSDRDQGLDHGGDDEQCEAIHEVGVDLDAPEHTVLHGQRQHAPAELLPRFTRRIDPDRGTSSPTLVPGEDSTSPHVLPEL